MMNAIEVSQLTKVYLTGKGHAPVHAVDHIDFAVREVFEAQTLANVLRFPMMFLGGVFVPVDSLPTGLQIVARLLPLTYAVEVIRMALTGTPFDAGLPDLAVLAGFTAVLIALAVRILGHHFD